MDQVVDDKAVGGDEGMGEEETNATALLGLRFPKFPAFAEGVFIGERRQDFVGDVVGGGNGV